MPKTARANQVSHWPALIGVHLSALQTKLININQPLTEWNQMKGMKPARLSLRTDNCC